MIFKRFINTLNQKIKILGGSKIKETWYKMLQGSNKAISYYC